MSLDTSKTYVYGSGEVRLTGRYAKKEGSGRKAATILVEIIDVSIKDNDPKFCKWVQFKELSEIIDPTKHTKQ